MGRFSEGCCFIVFAIGISTCSWAQTFPDGFSRQLVSGSITKPTGLAFAPDGRIFVTQQNGLLRIIKDGVLLTTPFLTLTVDGAGERGLIGIAIDPDFAENQFIYLYYTVPGTPAHNRVSRFTAQGDLALAGSETILLELDPLSSNVVHNGGALAFGHDGKIYIGVGDNAKPTNAQNLTTYNGKILRINRDGSIPTDNPFIASSNHAKRIWALGVRNPFSFAVNRIDGTIYVNDVGANAWEEINDVTNGGQNFGWPDDHGVSANPDYVDPVYTYAHGSGDNLGCAITGGAFFAPLATNYPSKYYGKYLFQDYCEGWINGIDPEEEAPIPSVFARDIASTSLCLTTGTDGNLYYLSREPAIYKIVYGNMSPPFVIQQPEDVEVLQETSAVFKVRSIGSLPLAYQWKKDGMDIPGATESVFTIDIVDPDDAGDYTVRVTNAGGQVTSDVAVLSVIPVLGAEDENPENRNIIYPNPARNGMATLQLYSTIDERISIVLYDQLSKIDNVISVPLTSGINRIDLPVAELPPGVYTIIVSGSNKKSFLKLVIL